MRATRWVVMAASLLFAVTAQLAAAADALPGSYRLIEAETSPMGPVKPDAEASGGRFVSQSGAYQPVFAAAVPRDLGDTVSVWVRYRGVGMQLKATDAAGKQSELDWLYGAPEEFTWARFGRYPRSRLGDSILIIRGTGDGAGAGVDAVALAAGDSFDPTRDLPPIVSPAPVKVAVDWRRAIAEATTLSYGLNAFHGFDPKVMGNARYQSNMRYMRPGLIRFHNWGMLGDSAKSPDGWLDVAHHGWDAARVRAALRASYPYGPAVMINIPGWPAWMDADSDGFLDRDQVQPFARLCADLVRIVNKESGGPKVLYWEVTNEQDGRYFGDFYQDAGNGPLKDASRPDRLDELVGIYRACARAMRKVDPSIKIGGPAITRPDVMAFVRRFVSAALPDLDFVTYHAYASGSRDDSDRQIYNRTKVFGSATREILAFIGRVSPTRKIPAFLDEFNISWTWETRDPRMANVKGAVFDALSLEATVEAGAAGTTAWNDRDGIYGKMDNDGTLRPSAELYHLVNHYFVGRVVTASTDAPDAVVAYAVAAGRGAGRSLLLVNRTSVARRVDLTAAGLPAPRRYVVADGASASAGVLPPHSVTVLTTVPASAGGDARPPAGR